MKDNNTISIVIRTMPGRERFLDRCLFILTAQTYTDIEPIIVVQKRSEIDSSSSIESIISIWKSWFDHIQLLVHTAAHDARSHSLNLGMNAAKGRYIAFLDDDDKVYPEHYANLVFRLQKSKYAWAYADTILATYNIDEQLISRTTPFKRNGYSFLQHLKGNFIPIHSFLVDRHRVKPLEKFDESMDRNEDYDFLLRLAYRHEPLYVEKYSAEYAVRSDGTNTNTIILSQSHGLSPSEIYEKKQRWIEMEQKLQQKKAIHFGWWIREIDNTISLPIPDYGENTNNEWEATQPKQKLDQIYRSFTWKLIRFFRKLNWSLRGRIKKKDIRPHSNSEATMILIRIYSSLIWQFFSPVYMIESILRRFRH